MLGARLLPIVLALGATSPSLAQHAPALVGEDATPKTASPETDPEKTASVRTRRGVSVLQIGDPAPPLRLAKIIAGPSDAKRLNDGDITVIEFWATWCAPCVAGIPKLDEIARRHRSDGVFVIGVTREEETVVDDFLGRLESTGRPTYAIAIDDDGQTTAAYMAASRRQGIPCVFVVDRNGRIAWLGHPKDLADPLRRIVAGTWDLEEARRVQARSERVRQVTMAINREIESADSRDDLLQVVASIDEAIARGDGHAGLELEKFRILVGPLGDRGAYELGWSLLEHHPNDAWLLSQVAEIVLDDEWVSEPDISFALETAKAADRAAAGSDPWILATLARAYRRSGDERRADRFAQRALSRIPAEDRDRLVLVLEQD